MKLTKIESYEIQAFAFRVMTGYMAPGKDSSPLADEAPYEERCAAFDEWRNEHAPCILAMLHGFEALIDRDDEPTRALLDRLDAAEAEVERLRHDIERHIAIASELATENERLRAELAEVRPDCRTCQHFYSDFDLGEAQCGFNNTGVGILCVAGDRHEPFDPVRLYAIDAAMAGGENG